MASKILKKLGWFRDLPDFRDLKMTKVAIDLATLPPVFHNLTPEIWDQGQLGSCTGHGAARALAFDYQKQNGGKIMPSRLQLYYNARRLEQSTKEDSGATIRDVIKGAAKYGAAPESLWPYNIVKFAVAPSRKATDAATHFKALRYESVPQDEATMKSVLAAQSLLVIGFSVFQSFESQATDQSGVVSMPQSSESLLGGHCVAVTGYNETGFFFDNSWGSGWGNAGSGWFPKEYLLNRDLAGDFWTVKTVTMPKAV